METSILSRSSIGSGSLSYSSKQLTDFPTEIFSGKLWNLKSLTLRDNEIKTIPTSLNRLYYLTDLDLTNNEIESIDFLSFSHLNQLTLLNLSYNYIDDLTPFYSMKSLRALYLSDNKISKIPTGISKLSSLTILNLNRNYIKDIPNEISKLNNLKSLHLEGNLISTLPESISSMKQLTKVSLSKNNFPFDDSQIIRSDIPYEYAVLVMRASRLITFGWTSEIHRWLPSRPRIQISFILWGIKYDIKPISTLPFEIWSMIFDYMIKDMKISNLRMYPKEIVSPTKFIPRLRNKCTIQ